MSGQASWRCAKVPTCPREMGSGGLLLPVQCKPTICPPAPGCSTEPGDQERLGATSGPAPNSVTCGASCAFPILTKRGLLLWFGLLSFLDFPLRSFPLPVVGSCQAVAVFVRGQKQRIWTSDMGWGLGAMGGRAGQECHPQEEMSLANKPGNAFVPSGSQTNANRHRIPFLVLEVRESFLGLFFNDNCQCWQ